MPGIYVFLSLGIFHNPPREMLHPLYVIGNPFICAHLSGCKGNERESAAPSLNSKLSWAKHSLQQLNLHCAADGMKQIHQSSTNTATQLKS